MFSTTGTTKPQDAPQTPSPLHNHESQGTRLTHSHLFSGNDKGSSHLDQHVCCNALAATVPSPLLLVPAQENVGLRRGGGHLEQPATAECHHSSTRFFRMISRTSAVASSRILSMGSSVRQKRTTLPSGFTRNFQKFHLGIFCTESGTGCTTTHG